MRGNTTFDDAGKRDAQRRGWRVGIAAAGMLTMAASLTACGGASKAGPAVASVSAAATPASAAAAGGTKPSALAYSQCMRAHGVTSFPDPDGNGDLKLDAQAGSDLDPNSTKFKAADAACKSLRPPATSVPAGEVKADNVKYAHCMRSHGISDFPDPNPDGTLQIEMHPGTDLDPANPAFTTADNACKQFQYGGGKGGSTNISGSGAGGGK